MAKKVLVVDDVAFARQIISNILIKAGYQVVGEATNGQEAVDTYEKLLPDFVTMDIVMPKKNGIEASRQIIEKHQEAKIIIISAMNHEQLLMDAINAGARDYLLKPFSPEDLLKAVEKIFTEEDEFEGIGASASS